MQIADFDRSAPPHAAAKAAEAGRAEVRHYPCDHFDVWPGSDWFEPALAHQVVFLRRHLTCSDRQAPDRTCIRSPWGPNSASSSVGWRPRLAITCGVRVSNSTTSPGPRSSSAAAEHEVQLSGEDVDPLVALVDRRLVGRRAGRAAARSP